MNHVKFQRSEKMRHKSPLLPSLEFMTSLCDYFALYFRLVGEKSKRKSNDKSTGDTVVPTGKA